jgi:hypothetical protein
LEPRETALQVKNSFDFYRHAILHVHRLTVVLIMMRSANNDNRKNGTAETMDMGMIMQAILKNGVGTSHDAYTQSRQRGLMDHSTMQDPARRASSRRFTRG